MKRNAVVLYLGVEQFGVERRRLLPSLLSFLEAVGADLRLSSTGGSAFVAVNPAGCVARYSASALVPLVHFKARRQHPPVIDERLLQFATSSMAGYAAFDAGAIKIETMYDGMESLF